MKKTYFIIILLCAILLASCASTKEKAYIVETSKALDILVPKYLSYVENTPPETAKIEALLDKYTKKATSDEKTAITALLDFLKNTPAYDADEKEAISKSYKQMLSTAKTAREEAEK